MERLAFKMQLHKGKEQEYKKRHDEIWPELSALLKDSGISNYSIFLDEDSLSLFGVLDCSDNIKFEELPRHSLMKKWWEYMKDLMETNPDSSPVSLPLAEVFFLK